MPDYNFHILSPPEFEDISRDLLQKQRGFILESFTSGRDGGIDLREPNLNIVVQCKRSANYVTLFASLKKEIAKIKRLKPKEYVIVTSVGLTPHQKDEIQKLFPKFLKSTDSIYGKQDLNNLLGLFPEIEKKHFKLWLSSTPILERILHARLINQSSFEEDNIKETIQLYVENESYFQSSKILQEKKYVIISGIPGIGKTTLARMLVYQLLASGIEDFIFISDSIKDAYTLFKDGRKQVFLFDDFLGRNFLESRLSNNEEKQIVSFIKKINRSVDKFLILTTREYILVQAKQKYDVLGDSSLEFAKCVIDLSEYTYLIRAKILYNHLFFSDLPKEYIQALVESKSYEWIIQHENYNPRIIEVITNEDVRKGIDPQSFPAAIKGFFDYPHKVWKHVYENQISKLSSYVLANLMTAGTPILYEDLQKLIQTFVKHHSVKYGISCSDLDYKKSIQELEGTFIITKRDASGNTAIEYQNPSVQDFLVNYFKESPDSIQDILTAAPFYNQLFTVFAIEENYISRGKLMHRTNKIVLGERLKNIWVQKLLTEYNLMGSSVIRPVYYSGSNGPSWRRSKLSDYQKLNRICGEILLSENSVINKFVAETFFNVILPTNLDQEDFSDYLNLLDEFKSDFDFDKSEVIKSYFESIYLLQELNDFERFADVLPMEYQDFVENKEDIKQKIYRLMLNEEEQSENEFLEDTLDEIGSISRMFKIDISEIKNRIETRIKENEVEKSESTLKVNMPVVEPAIAHIDEEQLVKKMFGTLVAERS